jgi:hypothetical protein
MGMTYIKVYHDWKTATKALSQAEKGRLIDAMVEYANGGEIPVLSGGERYVFPTFQAQIDRDAAAYADVSSKRREAGSKGGKQKVANASKCEQTIANSSKFKQDKDKDEDKDKEDSESFADAKDYVADGNAEPGSPASDRVDYQAVVDLYHSIFVNFPKVRSLTDKRRKAIGARLKKYTIDDVREVFEHMEASSFLKGSNNRNWHADFDWCMMSDQHFANILEGKYDGERGGSSNGGHSSSQGSSGGENQTADDPRQYWNGISF